MGVATGLLALLLVVLDAFLPLESDRYTSSAFPEQVLRVFIRHKAAEPNPGPKAEDPPISSVPRERETETPKVVDGHEATRIAPSQSFPVQRPPVDWNQAILESITVSEGEKQKQGEVRESMWRQTRSVMFQPAAAFVPSEPAPVIAELRFKPEIHVVGLGFTIGSCFIGLPLVGVPVEERTAAIRIFVCADESG